MEGGRERFVRSVSTCAYNKTAALSFFWVVEGGGKFLPLLPVAFFSSFSLPSRAASCSKHPQEIVPHRVAFGSCAKETTTRGKKRGKRFNISKGVLFVPNSSIFPAF